MAVKPKEADAQILISIPSRGRSHYLPALLHKLAATKSENTTIVVVSNGPVRFQAPPLPGIYVVHIGDVPTIPVSVNFGWYTLRGADSILVKLDNDIDPPDNWESEIRSNSVAIDLGGFLCFNETEKTEPIVVDGFKVRSPHISESWNIPFIWSAFLWLSPRIADKILYEDERFVRSDDGEVAERAQRIPGARMAYCHDSGIFHRTKLFEQSTEHYELLKEMYAACDLLIKELPKRPILQNTIWHECISRQEAEQIVLSNGTLPAEVTEKARTLLRNKLDEAFTFIGKQELVGRIFSEI